MQNASVILFKTEGSIWLSKGFDFPENGKKDFLNIHIFDHELVMNKQR